MKKLSILVGILCMGLLNAQNQNLNDIKSFKQQIMHPEEFQNLLIYKSKHLQRGENDFGNAPDLNWAKQFGGSGNDFPNDILTDADGNLIITGSFSGDISIASDNFSSNGARDGFVAKFDTDGNLMWLTQFQSNGNYSVTACGLALDTSGNIWVTGDYSGSATFDSTTLPDVNNFALFVSKLDENGNILMAYYHSELENEKGLEIELDNIGNVYVTGSISTEYSWRHPSLLIKFDGNGNSLWYQEHYAFSFNDIEVVNSSIYITGNFNNSEYLDDDVYLEKTAAYDNSFLAKADLDGNYTWAAVGTHDSNNGTYGDSFSEYLEVDESENIYWAGFIRRGGVTFGSDVLLVNGDYDGFLVKCDSSGEFIWAKQVEEQIEDLFIDAASGNIDIIYANNITGFSVNGIEQFTDNLDNFPTYLTFDATGNQYLAGSEDGIIFLKKNADWDIQFEGNSASAYVIAMVTDNGGNVYTYAFTSNTIEYLGEEVNKGIFICKQSGNGELIWLKQFPYNQSMNYSSQGNYLNIDKSAGYIYITGSFSDQIIIPGETTLVANENGGVFVLKYDLDGDYVWSVVEDVSVGWGEPSVVPDHSGNIILTGTFQDQGSIGNITLVPYGGSDGFVAKYDESGNVLWAFSAGGTDYEYITIAVVDSSDNIYISGEYDSFDMTIDETEVFWDEGEGNILLAKVSPDGEVQWIKNYAATGHDYYDYYCWPTGIKMSNNDFIYMKGSHADSVVFDGIVLPSSDRSYKKFIAKIDLDGNVVWIKSINTNTRSYSFDYNQFDIDNLGNVYFGVQAKDTVYFGDDFMYVPEGSYDLYVAKYTSDGQLDWVKTLQGNEASYNWISSVAVYGTENVFISGFIDNYLSIENTELLSTNRHAFVTMLGDNINGVKEVYNSKQNNFEVYPNPSTGIITVNTYGVVEIVNITGQMVYSNDITNQNKEINLNFLAKGVYFIRIANNENIKPEKFILR